MRFRKYFVYFTKHMSDEMYRVKEVFVAENPEHWSCLIHAYHAGRLCIEAPGMASLMYSHIPLLFPPMLFFSEKKNYKGEEALM